MLHNLTVELWPDASTRPPLYGPDPHSFHGMSTDRDKTALKYMSNWLDACARLGVPIVGVTHHEYIEVEPTAAGFTNASVLDTNAVVARAVNGSVRRASPTVAIVGGEIGPHNGGSPPCNHTSMRWAVFGDSLWYADAMWGRREAYAVT